jgi:hypothetical protein
VEDTLKECERYEGSRQHQLRERQETNNGYWWQHGNGVNILLFIVSIPLSLPFEIEVLTW